MPNDGFAVDPDQLRAAASTARTHAQTARDQIGLFTHATAQVVDGVGNLDAGNAVTAFAARWTHQLTILTELVDGVQAGLTAAAGAYQATDQDGAASFQTGPDGPSVEAGGP